MKARLEAAHVTAAYGQALRKLGELSGFDPRKVLLGEAGIILKTCMGRTKVSNQAKADRRTWSHILGKRGLDVTGGEGTKAGDITVNAGVRGLFGRIWVKTRRGKFRLAGQLTPGGQSVRWMRYRWRPEAWTDLQEVAADVAIQAKKKIPRGRRAVGLGRQSWLQIADALGINMSAVQGGGSLSAAGIAKARNALAVTGTAHRNGTGATTGDKIKTTVTMINRLPYGVASGMDKTLLYVIHGRAKYFEKSYANGAFDSIKTAARAYPWLRVSASGGL